jgi:flavin-dependent thymidylate synthase
MITDETYLFPKPGVGMELQPGIKIQKEQTKMKVTLIDYTMDAINKLLYTKNTRLTQGEDTMKKITAMTADEKAAELDYIARTVPSSWEFVTYCFQITGVTRAFTHQLVRTRTGSYAQQAMRITNMQDFDYYTGPSIMASKLCRDIYDDCMGQINRAYARLLDAGAKPEDARGVLPTNIHTNIIAQYNLRSFADLVKKRTSLRAQSEYREFMELAVTAVLDVHPWARPFIIPERLEWIKELQLFIGRDCGHGHCIDETAKLNALKLLDLLK